MDDVDFSDDFCGFLQAFVTTVDAAELLLLLHANPDKAWQPRELISRLEPSANVSEPDAARYLDNFQSAGLIVRGDDGRVRYRAASPELDEQVRQLARLYNERPVTLIRVIYALRDSKIKTFADAFRIWRN